MENVTGFGWLGLEEDDDNAGPQWLHVGAGARYMARVISHEPYCYIGHWSKQLGEVAKCTAPSCCFCVNGIAQQRRFVLEILLEEGVRKYLELGRSAMLQITSQTAKEDGLRGSGLLVRRPLGGGNPGLLLTVSLPSSVHIEPSDPSDVAAVLAAQWDRQAQRLSRLTGSIRLPVPITQKQSFFSDLERVKAVKVLNDARERKALNP